MKNDTKLVNGVARQLGLDEEERIELGALIHQEKKAVCGDLTRDEILMIGREIVAARKGPRKRRGNDDR